jgi:hypothetical protein
MGVDERLGDRRQKRRSGFFKGARASCPHLAEGFTAKPRRSPRSAERGESYTKGSKVMDCRIAIFAASSRGARPPSGAPPRALAARLKKPACGYSNLSMSVAGRNRRHPRRARSPRPDATAPLSKSPKAIGFWYQWSFPRITFCLSWFHPQGVQKNWRSRCGGSAKRNRLVAAWPVGSILVVQVEVELAALVGFVVG